jgi:HEAT repeat protein
VRGNRCRAATVRMAAAAVAASTLPLAALAIVLLAPAPARAADGDEASQDLQRLGSVLNSPSTSATDREDAARRLVSRHSPGATAILRSSFQRQGNVAAQVAIAKALSQDPAPDPAFVGPMTNALGPDPRLDEAAADALVNYRDNAQVPQILENAANNQLLPDLARVAIIRALGGIIQKPVARYLRNKLLDPNESGDVQDAAADALGEMTGLRDAYQRDRQRWSQWWNNNASQSDDAWRADVLGNQLRQFKQTRQRYDQLVHVLSGTLGFAYAQLPPAAKAATILGYLSSTTPELRAAGAGLVSGDFEGNRAVPPEVRQQLRSLIGDSDPGVRLAVVTTLETMNDRSASPALITQLVQETDPNVKKRIAEALGQMHDPAAVPALLRMLQSGYFDEGAAAADALVKLAPTLRQSDPAGASACADALEQMLNDPRTGGATGATLRAACTAALAALAPPQAAATFRDLLRAQNPQPDPVRIAALAGLGALADANSASMIANLMSDPNADVRLAAAKALASIATFGQAEQLYGLLDPANETDARVREAAWLDLVHVLRSPAATKEDLVGWPDRFKDPERRLVALQALADAVARDRNQLPPRPADQQAADDQFLAEQRQNIGETLMELKHPDEAATAYQLALEYWRGAGRNQPGSETTLDGLVGDMMDALLAGRQYETATDFAEQQLTTNPAYQLVVGPRIKSEASRLAATDPAAATRLIDDALNLGNPPLEQRYTEDLRQTRDQLNRAGATPPPGGP